MQRFLSGLVASLMLCALLGVHAGRAEPSHAIAMHGEPALSRDYRHFTYVDPDAPKGGRIDYAVRGSFDSLNPFIVQGDASRGLFDQEFGYNVFEALMARSRDETFTLYPLIAESVETDEERSFIEFTLDPAAKFSDGEPITVEDVLFSMNLLKEKARPLYRRWIGLVAKMEQTGERGVRFTLKPEADRELPLLLGLLPILPKHATDAENFDKSTLKPMIASGPYTIDSVKPGELVVLKRNPDYWAKDHPSKRGFDNFDEVRINYYRDDNAMFEAFKKGLISIRTEADPGRWAEGYDFPAAGDGRVVKEAFESGLPSGMLGFVFNTRKHKFADPALRRALASLFDFEWANRNLFFGAYERTRSYFDGSELSSQGNPASDEEKALVADFPGAVLPELLAGTWKPPVSDGSGRDRGFLKQGFDQLHAAGYKLVDRRLVGPDGEPLGFEILLNGKSGEAVASSYKRTLEKLGIEVTIRIVEAAQYQQRLQTYDYDMIMQFYPSSLSPGAEQIGRWGSASADADGTYNFAGVADKAVDAMIDALLNARNRADFVSAVRMYDRVLLTGAYVVPLYHRGEKWVARWSNIAHPNATPVYGPQFQTWWQASQ
ncbi:MAG: extracellular solute-binding protein [Rhizobiaceae bacterium]